MQGNDDRLRSVRRLIMSLVTLAWCMVNGPVVRAQDAPPSEYQLKAAFLYNFAKFVEWPATTFPDATTPFTIGILGEDPSGGDLERTIKNKTVSGRPLQVKPIKALSEPELKNCQILFICASERKRLPEILKAVSGAAVLTVSEMEGFLLSGGMINFVMEGNKVRFEIKDETAKAARLRISSKLLSLAKQPEKQR